MKHKKPPNPVLILTPVAVLFVLSAAAAIHASFRPVPPAGPLQAGIVETYGASPSMFGDSCGVVAVVRLKNGAVVRAAAAESDDLQKGMRVTVSKQQSSCPPAPYMVLPGNPSPGVASGAPQVGAR